MDVRTSWYGPGDTSEMKSREPGRFPTTNPEAQLNTKDNVNNSKWYDQKPSRNSQRVKEIDDLITGSADHFTSTELSVSDEVLVTKMSPNSRSSNKYDGEIPNFHLIYKIKLSTFSIDLILSISDSDYYNAFKNYTIYIFFILIRLVLSI